MHDYAIDRHPKEKVLFVLAFMAIMTTPYLNSGIASAADSIGLSNVWITTLGTAVPVSAFFGLLYFVFDRYLWKLRVFRMFLLVPDINGSWQCDGRTSQKEGAAVDFKWTATITITQSWSKILIHLQTPQSASRSTSASIYHDEGVGYRLLYQYRNEPRADEIQLSNHAGSAEIRFQEDCSGGDGHYFTDRHRNTVGTMTLRRAHADAS